MDRSAQQHRVAAPVHLLNHRLLVLLLVRISRLSTAGSYAHDALVCTVVLLLSSLSLKVLDYGSRALKRPNDQAVVATRREHAVVRTEGDRAEPAPKDRTKKP